MHASHSACLADHVPSSPCNLRPQWLEEPSDQKIGHLGGSPALWAPLEPVSGSRVPALGEKEAGAEFQDFVFVKQLP